MGFSFMHTVTKSSVRIVLPGTASERKPVFYYCYTENDWTIQTVDVILAVCLIALLQLYHSSFGEVFSHDGIFLAQTSMTIFSFGKFQFIYFFYISCILVKGLPKIALPEADLRLKHQSTTFSPASSAIMKMTDFEKNAIAHSMVRNRRDGGMISGPVATALVTGMIGMTAKAVQDITAYHPFPSQGGCGWFGTSPFCNYYCPPDYDFIREHNGRCSHWWFAGFCVPDPSFGEACSTLLGKKFTKRFCCKSDPSECAWSGRWMGAFSSYNAYCRYDHTVGRCGRLSCTINHYNYKAQNASEITGQHCDRVDLFGYRGHASCGYIAFFDADDNLKESWYKTG